MQHRTVKTCIPFLDSTNNLMKAGRLKYIHGENDHKHFSLIGYKLVGNFISDNLKKCFPSIDDT